MSQELSKEFSYQDIEIELFMLINSYRQNPKSLILYLKSLIPQFNGNVYTPKSGQDSFETQEGVSLVHEAIKFIKNQKPLEPFKLSKGLYLSARDHSNDINKNGLASHKGSNNSNLSQRVDIYGRWRVMVAENIAFNDCTAEDIFVNFILDDGSKGRGHRLNLFNEKLEVIGIACGEHSTYGHSCVINFAGQMEEFPDLENDSSELMDVLDFFEEFIGKDAINDLVYSDETTEEFIEDSSSNNFSATIEGKASSVQNQKETANENLRFDSFKKRESKDQKETKMTQKPAKSKFQKYKNEIMSSNICKLKF
jgi:uncharacterized protein YkwD